MKKIFIRTVKLNNPKTNRSDCGASAFFLLFRNFELKNILYLNY